MPPRPKIDWARVRRSYAAGDKSVAALAAEHAISPATLRRRIASEGWAADRAEVSAAATPPAGAPRRRTTSQRSSADGLGRRRALLKRITRAIEKTLDRMEHRMASDDEPLPLKEQAADQERDSRVISSLLKSLEKVGEFETELDRTAGSGKSPDTRATAAPRIDARDLADEADRFRREIAERLARLCPPSS